MEIDKIIYILAFIAFFFYRQYMHYKKEQEKTGRKPQQQDFQPSSPQQESPPRQPSKSPFEEIFGEWFEEETPQPYQPEKPYREPLPVEERVPAFKEQRVPEGINTETRKVEAPVKEGISPEGRHKLTSRKVVSHEPERVPFDFDLRDAVIKSAVLQRPEW